MEIKLTSRNDNQSLSVAKNLRTCQGKKENKTKQNTNYYKTHMVSCKSLILANMKSKICGRLI